MKRLSRLKRLAPAAQAKDTDTAPRVHQDAQDNQQQQQQQQENGDAAGDDEAQPPASKKARTFAAALADCDDAEASRDQVGSPFTFTPSRILYTASNQGKAVTNVVNGTRCTIITTPAYSFLLKCACMAVKCACMATPLCGIKTCLLRKSRFSSSLHKKKPWMHGVYVQY
jgi:hypothetical protein